MICYFLARFAALVNAHAGKSGIEKGLRRTGVLFGKTDQSSSGASSVVFTLGGKSLENTRKNTRPTIRPGMMG